MKSLERQIKSAINTYKNLPKIQHEEVDFDWERVEDYCDYWWSGVFKYHSQNDLWIGKLSEEDIIHAP